MSIRKCGRVPLWPQVITEESVRQWVRQLHKDGFLYHFDDNAHCIIKVNTEEPVFTKAEADYLNATLDTYYPEWSQILFSEALACMGEDN